MNGAFQIPYDGHLSNSSKGYIVRKSDLLPQQSLMNKHLRNHAVSKILTNEVTSKIQSRLFSDIFLPFKLKNF